MCPRHSKTGPARDPTMGSQPLPKLCHLALRSMFDISGPNLDSMDHGAKNIFNA